LVRSVSSNRRFLSCKAKGFDPPHEGTPPHTKSITSTGPPLFRTLTKTHDGPCHPAKVKFGRGDVEATPSSSPPSRRNVRPSFHRPCRPVQSRRVFPRGAVDFFIQTCFCGEVEQFPWQSACAAHPGTGPCFDPLCPPAFFGNDLLTVSGLGAVRTLPLSPSLFGPHRRRTPSKNACSNLQILATAIRAPPPTSFDPKRLNIFF